MEDISRRSLFAGACAAILVGSSLVPQAASASIKKLPKDRLSVKLSGVPQLAKVGGSVQIGLIKKIPVAIARTGPSSYVAFNLSCPHAGVIVNQTPEGWLCNAHLSRFAPDGALAWGPATTGLKSVPIKVSKGVATVG